MQTSTTDPYLAQQERRESNARSYPRRLPVTLVHGAGIYVTTADGRTYLDCLAAAGTLTLGHNHRVVVEAIRHALDSGVPMQTLDFATPHKHAFVEELFARLPGQLADDARVQFCSPAGTDAVEAALKLAEIATQRSGFLAFRGGYHGMTRAALALSSQIAVRRAVAGIDAPVHILNYPTDISASDAVAGADEVAQTLARLAASAALPAAVLVEVVQGEGGSVPAPDGWLRSLREVCTSHGVLLIVDEVQTGGGRTGRMFAVEHTGITPDVLVLSKAIGGGQPLALIVYHRRLDRWNPGAHAGTFRGNQLAFAAGAAALRYTVQAGLPGNAEAMGRLLARRLREVAADVPAVGGVRGRGLMLGVQVVDPEAAPGSDGVSAPDGRRAARLQQECLRHGLIVEVGGPDSAVLRFLPPLTVTVQEVEAIAERFGAALNASRANLTETSQ